MSQSSSLSRFSVAAAVEGQDVSVIWDASGEPLRVIWVETMEDLVLEVWGWEWDVRRMVVEGSGEVVWEAMFGHDDDGPGSVETNREAAKEANMRKLVHMLAESHPVDVDLDEWCLSEAADSDDEQVDVDLEEWCPSEAADSDDEQVEPPPQTLAKEEQIKAETLRLLNEGLAKEWGEASVLAEHNILRASFAEGP
ncbi:hypothetical protein T484DRAFT_1803078 [Baffinella frigidus]|nr:hypothetical protein T484DRAFT_1803078 [Cryptophyta sp. CCMP2293]